MRNLIEKKVGKKNVVAAFDDVVAANGGVEDAFDAAVGHSHSHRPNHIPSPSNSPIINSKLI